MLSQFVGENEIVGVVPGLTGLYLSLILLFLVCFKGGHYERCRGDIAVFIVFDAG
jgi:ABC-type antimicrobial peptide transport system permease subunit